VTRGIPFQHCHLGQVQSSSFTFSVTFADLKNPFKAGSQKTFHAQLRRCLQKPGAAWLGLDVGFGCRSRYPVRCFYLKIAVSRKVLTNGSHDDGPEFKIQFYFGRREARHKGVFLSLNPEQEKLL
jgi:hypothetical protein